MNGSVHRRENPALQQLFSEAHTQAENQTRCERGERPNEVSSRNKWHARCSELNNRIYVDRVEKSFNDLCRTLTAEKSHVQELKYLLEAVSRLLLLEQARSQRAEILMVSLQASINEHTRICNEMEQRNRRSDQLGMEPDSNSRSQCVIQVDGGHHGTDQRLCGGPAAPNGNVPPPADYEAIISPLTVTAPPLPRSCLDQEYILPTSLRETYLQPSINEHPRMGNESEQRNRSSNQMEVESEYDFFLDHSFLVDGGRDGTDQRLGGGPAAPNGNVQPPADFEAIFSQMVTALPPPHLRLDENDILPTSVRENGKDENGNQQRIS